MYTLFPKTTEYALRALVEMASHPPRANLRVRDICKAAGVPEAYVRKTFQTLVRGGFLDAVTGPGGGYSLALDPAVTTVLQVIEAVEGTDYFQGCVLGLKRCSEAVPCALHFTWKEVKTRLLSKLAAETLIDLAQTSSDSKRKNGKKRSFRPRRKK